MALSSRPAAGAVPATLAALVQDAAASRTGTAVVAKRRGVWRCWSWRELAEEIGQIAAALDREGVTAGDRVAVLGPSRPRLTFTILALQRLDAVPVLPRSAEGGEDLPGLFAAHDIRHAVVAGQPEVEALAKVRHRLTAALKVIYDDPRGLGGRPEGWLIPLDRALAAAVISVPPAAFADPEAPALVLFSAGSTGSPRPVSLTHAGLAARVMAAAAVVGLRTGELARGIWTGAMSGVSA